MLGLWTHPEPPTGQYLSCLDFGEEPLAKEVAATYMVSFFYGVCPQQTGQKNIVLGETQLKLKPCALVAHRNHCKFMQLTSSVAKAEMNLHDWTVHRESAKHADAMSRLPAQL